MNRIVSLSGLLALMLPLMLALVGADARADKRTLSVRPDGSVNVGDACPVPRGSRIASGEITARYGSIQAAVDCAEAGDRIALRIGSFDHPLEIRDKKLAIQGDPGAVVTGKMSIFSSDVRFNKVPVVRTPGAYDGPTLTVGDGAKVSMTNCAFHGPGPADDPAVVVNAGSKLNLSRCRFTSWHSQSAGGAIANSGSLRLLFVDFWGNSSLDGGAIYNEGFLSSRFAEFVQNGAAAGGDGITNLGVLRMFRPIFSGNGVDIFNHSGGSVKINRPGTLVCDGC